MINDIDGLILAAGRSKRMGCEDKLKSILHGKTLLEHVIDRLEPQVGELFINANPDLCGEQSLTVIGDHMAGFQGPLTGLWSALKSDRLSDASYLMMVPCDGPFIPQNLVVELYQMTVKNDADIACVRYQGFAQPTFSLWNKRVLSAVEETLLVKKMGGFKSLLAELNTVYLDWPEQPINPFFNINTPEDLAAAERLFL
ncbi:molybdenum cofactor guanylyltransferase [Porticoccaceae bacterium]|nr:molybdenum cofactor guanylyltransferase [Porticoccaceae bacterium]